MTVNWEGIIKASNGVRDFLRSLPEGTRTKLIEAFKILGNALLEPADKVAKVDELIAGVQDEKAKAFLHKAAEKVAAVGAWTKQRLAQEEETASDAEKEAKLNALVAGLNDTQIAAFKKFKAEADDKVTIEA